MDNLAIVPFRSSTFVDKKSRIRCDRVGAGIHDDNIKFILSITGEEYVMKAIASLGILDWTRAMPLPKHMTYPQLLTVVRRYLDASPALAFSLQEIVNGVMARHQDKACLQSTQSGQAIIEAKCIAGALGTMFSRYRDLRFCDKMRIVQRQAVALTFVSL